MSIFMQHSAILLTLGVLLLSPIAIILARGSQNIREGVSFASSIIAFVCILSLVPSVLARDIQPFTLFTILPGITVSFAVDGLGIIFGLIATFLWGFATSYNIGYMRTLKEHAQTRYYCCFSIAILGAIGVAFSANIFTLYLFYEVITVFTYPLVAHHQDEESFEGAKKYLVYLMGTSKLFLLPAMVLTYVLCGTLDMNFTDIVNGIFPADVVQENPNLVRITYVLYIAGLAKAALFPLHNWLPSAMVAPTPVSALLHAVAVVKAGVFSVSRIILSAFGTETMHSLWLGIPTAYLAAFTIVAASFVALTKDDIKARLAYSTVSQLSYVIIGVALLTPAAIQGGILHIPHHAFAKITLFFGAGAIFVATSIKKISEMNGLGRRMPWTFAAFGIASLSMIGIPPVSGFVSKWYLMTGAMEAHQTILLAMLLLSTLLNASYFAPIFYRAFFLQPAEGANLEQYGEAPKSMLVPLCITATISVLLGFYPALFHNFVTVFGNF